MHPITQAHPIILFDGVCNLCNASVRFIVDRDPRGIFRYASLQSETGQRLLAEHGQADDLSTLILIEDGKAYSQSSAALRIVRRLSGLWPALSALLVVPRPLRDLVYKGVAKRRYKWFGRTDECRIPTPGERERFLEV